MNQMDNCSDELVKKFISYREIEQESRAYVEHKGTDICMNKPINKRMSARVSQAVSNIIANPNMTITIMITEWIAFV